MVDTASSTDGSESRLYYIHALSPVHVGAGRGLGFVDLPIVREAVTGWPYVPGSAVKGVLADYHDASRDEDRDPDGQAVKKDPAAVERAKLRKLAFGRGGEEASNSGSLVFSDAHVICLAVRSLYGTFAWCTCPIALERLRRDLQVAHLDSGLPQLVIPSPSNGSLSAHLPNNPTSSLPEQGKVYLEDLDFDVVFSDAAASWATKISEWSFSDDTWKTIFCQRFAVLPDDAFSFLCESATQVDARVKIDDNTKTVADGQLWYEESLPAETLLAGIVWCGRLFGNSDLSDTTMRARILAEFVQRSTLLQIGGKATVGRGRVRISFTHSTAVSTTRVPQG